jgi:hypothetical protein
MYFPLVLPRAYPDTTEVFLLNVNHIVNGILREIIINVKITILVYKKCFPKLNDKHKNIAPQNMG